MALPLSDHQKANVQLSGGKVDVRGLSRSEALRLASHKDNVEALEKDLIMYATGTPKKDVASWYESATSADVSALVDLIMQLSGLTTESGKESSEA